MKLFFIKSAGFLFSISMLFISCSDEQKNVKEDLALDFLYHSDFMDQYKISSISILKLENGTYEYSVFPSHNKQQELLSHAYVKPGESKKCYSRECIGKELEECFNTGGKKAVLKKKLVGVEVSCE